MATLYGEVTPRLNLGAAPGLFSFTVLGLTHVPRRPSVMSSMCRKFALANCLFHRAFAPPAAFDDRRLEGQVAQLQNL
jgi:hypothetical protein